MPTAPKKIKIGPWVFKITVSRKRLEHYYPDKKDVDDTCGLFCAEEQEIVVSDDLAPDMIVDTVLHEVLHGIFYYVGARGFISMKKEEAIICMIGSALLDTLKRNPALVEYLMKGHDGQTTRRVNGSGKASTDSNQLQ